MDANAARLREAVVASPLTAKIEQQTAKFAKLEEESATLDSELAALVREQAEMDKICAEEKAQWEVKCRDGKGFELHQACPRGAQQVQCQG